jgi:sulfonate transport system permease protein
MSLPNATIAVESDAGFSVIPPVRSSRRPGSFRFATRYKLASSLALGVLFPVCLLALWWWAVTEQFLPAAILPAPQTVFATFLDLVSRGELQHDLSASLLRVAKGFAIGSALGIALGFALGVSSKVESWIGPIFRTIVQVPSLAWIPLLMLVFGIDETLKLVVMAKAALIPITFATASGIRNIPVEYREVGKVLRLKPGTMAWRVILPGALPSIFSGVRQGLSHVWVSLIIVEMLASTVGIGYLMNWGRTIFQLDIVMVCVVAVGAVGFTFDFGLKLLEKRLLPWHEQSAVKTATLTKSRTLNLEAAVPFAVLLGLWAIGTNLGHINPLFLPPLSDMARSVLDPEVQHNILGGLYASALRLVEGGAIGVAIGLTFGSALGLSKFLERLIGPTFHAFRQIAVFAWIPLLTAWLGTGETAKITFVALAAFKPATLGAYDGIRNVSTHYFEVGRVLCFSRSLMLRRIALPAAWPSIMTGVQLAFLFSWMAAIGAEYLIGSLSEGIGSFVMEAREMLRSDLVFVGIIVIAIIGASMNAILRVSTRRLFPWYQSA